MLLALLVPERASNIQVLACSDFSTAAASPPAERMPWTLAVTARACSCLAAAAASAAAAAAAPALALSPAPPLPPAAAALGLAGAAFDFVSFPPLPDTYKQLAHLQI